jgi:hypothetical protein
MGLGDAASVSHYKVDLNHPSAALQPVRFSNSPVHAGRRHEPELHCEPLVRQRCKRIYKLVLQGQSDRFVSYATAMHIESCEQVPVILQSTETTVG